MSYRAILSGLFLMLAALSPAFSQGVQVVGTCGSAGWVAGQAGRPLQIDTSGNLCTAASVSASITGFAPASTGTPISVANPAVTGTLPAGAVVVASNVGTTNNAFCKLGATATTSDQLIAPNSWFAFTVGVATQLTCITSTSTTTVNMVGGSGLPTGAGGGGGSGGGAVTNAGTFAVQLTGATNNINNVSGTVSLPTGASTAAKQPALGTAGTASTDVLSVQGIASMTPFLTNHASGSVASGAYASGSIASGAYASGSIASGALASGSIASGAMVDLLTVIGTKAAGTAATNSLLGGAVFNSSAPTLTNGQQAALQATAAGSLHTTVDNTNANGSATSANSSPVVIASDQAAVKVSPQAITTGGASTTGNIAANNTTAVVVKASAGTLYGVQLYGIGSAPAYLKIYNATSATCGSGTPVKRFMIPAASTAANGAGSNISFGAVGIAFGTGITYCVTTGITDADATAPAASTFLINIDWL